MSAELLERSARLEAVKPDQMIKTGSQHLQKTDRTRTPKELGETICYDTDTTAEAAADFAQQMVVPVTHRERKLHK